MTGDGNTNREFSLKGDNKKTIWRASEVPDLFYTREGQYKVYRRIDPGNLTEINASRASSPRISRRRLLKYGSVVAVSAVFGSTLLSYYYGRPQSEQDEIPPVGVIEFPRLRVAGLSDLEVGKPLDFRFPLDNFNSSSFIVKLGAPAIGGIGPEADIVSFNYMCTHMGCALIGMYNHDHHMLGPCPCHFTRFDLTKNGMVIIGQATENLPQVTLELDGENIYATGVMRLIYGYRSNLADVKPIEVA